MIESLQKIFKSVTKSLEVLYLLEGAKPAVRLMAPEQEKGIFSSMRQKLKKMQKKQSALRKKANTSV